MNEENKILNDEIYYKTVTARNVSCTTTGTEIAKVGVPREYKAIIKEVAASNDAVEIDFLREGQQTLGAKYGLPIYCETLPTNRTSVLLNIPIDTDFTIVGRGIGATTTLTALRIRIKFIKS